MLKLFKVRTNQKGGVLALAVVLLLVLIMIGVGFFAITLYFGGAQETKDAVNSGGLNVAKKALDMTVSLTGDPAEQFFNDVSDGGQISLRNINRVWAKALFVAVNAEAAQNDGGHAGSGGSSASAAKNAAQAISERLAQKLNTANNLYGFFDEYAKANSVRMLGIGAQVAANPGSDWKTSELERSYESNIEFVDNLPVGYGGGSLFTATKRNPAPADASGKKYLSGYSPLKVMGEDYWQVAYPFQQKPHVVDKKFFDDNSDDPLALGGGSWQHPVPNAFSVAGKTSNTSTGHDETAVSWVETNPQKVFPMQFPHGFIRVTIKKNTLNWKPEGLPGGSTSYGFSPDSKDSPVYPIGCGTMRATAYVGYEYLPPTLYKAICALPPINGDAIKYMHQRVQEMIPGYSQAAFIGKLNTAFVSGDDDQKFLIYPNPSGTDIMVMSEDIAVLPMECKKSAHADGSEQTLDTEPPLPAPNFATEEFDCYGSYTFPTLSFVSGTRKWVPGSGWDGGCLGELTVERETDVSLFGVCPCP